MKTINLHKTEFMFTMGGNLINKQETMLAHCKKLGLRVIESGFDTKKGKAKMRVRANCALSPIQVQMLQCKPVNCIDKGQIGYDYFPHLRLLCPCGQMLTLEAAHVESLCVSCLAKQPVRVSDAVGAENGRRGERFVAFLKQHEPDLYRAIQVASSNCHPSRR